MQYEERPAVNIRDLYLASALYHKGHELLGLEDVGGGRFEFMFPDTFGTAQAITEYWAGQLHCEAKGLFQAMKELKNRIYAAVD